MDGWEGLKVRSARILPHEQRIIGAAQNAGKEARKDVIVRRHLVGGRVEADAGGQRAPAPPQVLQDGAEGGEVARLVQLGARQARTIEERGEYFVNMFDPDGNEFDVQ